MFFFVGNACLGVNQEYVKKVFFVRRLSGGGVYPSNFNKVTGLLFTRYFTYIFQGIFAKQLLKEKFAEKRF